MPFRYAVENRNEEFEFCMPLRYAVENRKEEFE
jgi:hypothetical protein